MYKKMNVQKIELQKNSITKKLNIENWKHYSLNINQKLLDNIIK